MDNERTGLIDEIELEEPLEEEIESVDVSLAERTITNRFDCE